MIGYVPGSLDLVGLDVDRGGLKARKDLVAELGEPAASYMSNKPGRGHMLWQVSDGGEIPQGAWTTEHGGGDIRYKDGYLIAWQAPRLLKHLQKGGGEPVTASAVTALMGKTASYAEGGRNDRLFAEAVTDMEAGGDGQRAEERARAEGLPEQEIRRTLDLRVVRRDGNQGEPHFRRFDWTGHGWREQRHCGAHVARVPCASSGNGAVTEGLQYRRNGGGGGERHGRFRHRGGAGERQGPAGGVALPRNPLSHGAPARVSQVLLHPFIMREEGSGLCRVMNYLGRQRVRRGRVDIVMKFGDLDAVKVAVESGLSVSILSCLTIRKGLWLRPLGCATLIPALTRKLSRVIPCQTRPPPTVGLPHDLAMGFYAAVPREAA